MTDTLDLHGHKAEFNKKKAKAVIEIDLGDRVDECILVDIFTIDNKDYVALLSLENSQIYLFYYSNIYDNEEISLAVIEDEEEVEEIFHLFAHYWTDKKIDELVEEYKQESVLENVDLDD